MAYLFIGAYAKAIDVMVRKISYNALSNSQLAHFIFRPSAPICLGTGGFAIVGIGDRLFILVASSHPWHAICVPDVTRRSDVYVERNSIGETLWQLTRN